MSKPEISTPASRLTEPGLLQAVDVFELICCLVVADLPDIYVTFSINRPGTDSDVLPIALDNSLQCDRQENIKFIIYQEDVGAVTAVVVDPDQTGVARAGSDARDLPDLRIVNRGPASGREEKCWNQVYALFSGNRRSWR